MRLPITLDKWFWERLELKPELSASDMLISLVHGGLRLREGYMSVHRAALERLEHSGNTELYDSYVNCLADTFGPEYVRHLKRWLDADAARDAL